jgi:hypothetical protein
MAAVLGPARRKRARLGDASAAQKLARSRVAFHARVRRVAHPVAIT